MVDFLKPKTGEKQERVAAEFWQPSSKGDTLVGRIKSVDATGAFDKPVLNLERVMIFSKQADKVEGYESIKVGVNSDLQKYSHSFVDGHVVAITYSGGQQTPQGKMRTFNVLTMSHADYVNMINEHVPEAPWGDPSVDDDDEKLPF